MQTIGDRIKAFAKEKYGSVSALCREMGISPQGLSGYIGDKIKPGAGMQEKLRAAGADIEWLMTGERTKSGWDLVENKPVMYPSPVRDYVVSVPVFLTPVKAGNPTFISDEVNSWLEPAKYFNEKTYMLEVDGDSMKDAGIRHKDTIVVDKTKEPKNYSIVVARIGNGWAVRRLRKMGDEYYLCAENSDIEYPDISFDKNSDIEILGVVLMIATRL